jgi:membrane protein implicated in regulation of membrane protease activity
MPDLETSISTAFVVIGVLMLLAEAAAPGNFLLVPATVLLVLGGIGLVAPPVLFSWFSPIIAVLVLVPMTYVSIKLYQRLAPPAPPETTVATSLVGKEGLVEKEVSPDNLKGKVRIEHDTWSATSSQRIPAGRRVVVKSSEGVHVFVEEAGNSNRPAT